MRLFEESDREIIKELLQSNISCSEVSHKWDCDPTQLYRQLRRWKLDTKGNEVVRQIPLDEKRLNVINFVESKNYQTTVQEIALFTGYSWEFVKEVLIDRDIKILGKIKAFKEKRRTQVTLVNDLRAAGVLVLDACKIAVIPVRIYYEWSVKFGLQYKKAANK
jgi:transposase-like protein